MRISILVALLLCVEILQAQPLARYNLYPYNPDFANPAATGQSGCFEVNATDMHQWAGIANAPNIQSLSVQKGLLFSKNKKNGIGINLIRDSNGPSKIMGGEFLYSFHMLVGKNQSTWISLGLSGNMEQRRINEEDFTPVYDPEITGDMDKEMVYNAASGIYLYNERYFAGLAVYNLLPVNNSLGLGYGGSNYYLSLQGGYQFDFEKKGITLQTSAQVFAGKTEYQIDIGNKLRLNDHLWMGLTLRKNLGEFETPGQNLLVFLGYELTNWSFCYNYNFDINGTQFHHYGTHLISLSYRLCRDDLSCPAYR
jgi:type IX secretion system PorP/SprF family membrane protein